MDDQGAANSTHVNAPAQEREALLAAMLSLTGEVGYRQASVERVAARAGHSGGFLYSHFSGREECFAVAYAERADRLLARILTPCREGLAFPQALSAGLGELIAFATAEPLVARSLLAEVYVAGGAAKVKHEQILRRLSDAVSGTRRESGSSRHGPPPITASFIVGGLEEAVRRRVAERRPELLSEELPALLAFATAPYLQAPGAE